MLCRFFRFLAGIFDGLAALCWYAAAAFEDASEIRRGLRTPNGEEV